MGVRKNKSETKRENIIIEDRKKRNKLLIHKSKSKYNWSHKNKTFKALSKTPGSFCVHNNKNIFATPAEIILKNLRLFCFMIIGPKFVYNVVVFFPGNDSSLSQHFEPQGKGSDGSSSALTQLVQLHISMVFER